MTEVKKKSPSKKVKTDTKEEFEHFDSIAKLNPAQYWEWRTTIEEMNHAKTKMELAKLEIKICDRESAIVDRERKLKAKKYEKMNEIHDKMNNDYMKFTGRLETELDISMKNTVIEPHTYEVRKLVDDNDDGTFRPKKKNDNSTMEV